MDETPLDPDEAAALIPTHIQTRDELNEWEGANILAAEEWAFGRTRGHVLSIDFLKRLHARMFDEIWEWAGTFRRSEKNVGIPWEHIPEALRNLFDNAEYWLENDIFPLKEIRRACIIG